jgi:hemerythrin
MTDSFVWKKGYNVGVEEIDAQHENLFRIANALRSDLPPGRLEEELMYLYRHTREHFKAEEALMRDSGYPYYMDHRDQHDELLDNLNEIAAQIVKNPEKLPELKNLLDKWVKQHILNYDQGIAAYLRLGD